MTREYWDRQAGSFDDEADHGLADPPTHAAWRRLLLDVLPAAPARVADLGCGTGTLSRLLADEGYDVDGIDFSPEMIRRAQAKAPEATFAVDDASQPSLETGVYDVVLSRHVLWAMPNPESSIARWIALLKPGGLIVLIEGMWATGAGLSATDAERLLRTARSSVTVRPMPEAVFWGKQIQDERYLMTSPA